LKTEICVRDCGRIIRISLSEIRYRSQSCLVFTNVTSALEVFLNVMRYINPRFTYLLTYLYSGTCSMILKSRFTRNTLDCDQSNYSSSIVFSHIPIKFGQTANSAIRSADPENPTVEPNMMWIGRSLAEIWPFEIFPNEMLVGRSSVGRSSIYTSSYTDLIYSSLR